MKILLRILGIFILLCFCFIACNKDEIIPIDFRDKYIGKYQVHERISSYGFPECGTPYSYERDTIIILSYGDTDSTLNVLGRDVYLDSTGRYYDYHYWLRLWNDSIDSYYMNGGLGCGRYETYVGFKVLN